MSTTLHAAGTTLKHFLSKSQAIALAEGLAGEESNYFEQLITDTAQRIDAMPKTYEQETLGDQAIVHLHYFSGGGDWYITERDSDPDQSGQHQAFGLADPFGDGGELGYISIVELRQAGIELDLYWAPKTLAEIRAAR